MPIKAYLDEIAWTYRGLAPFTAIAGIAQQRKVALLAFTP